MNIWIVNHYYVPTKYPGGTRHHTIAKKLVERGHSVTVFASNYSHFSHQIIGTAFRDSGKAEIIDGIRVIWIKSRAYSENGIGRLLGMFEFAMGFGKIASNLITDRCKPDVVIGSNPHIFAAYAGLIFAKKNNTRFYYEIRDLWPESLVDIKNISKKHPLIIFMSYLQKKLVNKSDKIITLLPNLNEYLQSAYQYNSEQLFYFPNFVDLSLINNTFIKTEKKLFRFIYAGSHGPANGLNILLEAAEIIQNTNNYNYIEIMMIGNGSSKSELLKIANEKQLKNVIFCDPVPKQQIHEIISRADVGLMLLKKSDVFKWGISPNKLFDYMMLKKPVIFSVNCHNNPVEEFQSGITISPDSPDALADAMIRMANFERDVLKEMGENGYSYVKKFHCIETLLDNFSNIIHQDCLK